MTTYSRLLGALALTSVLSAHALPAQTQGTAAEKILKLDDVVVTATRTARPVDLTPGTITSVNLLEENAATLRDALRDDPLVSVPFTSYGTGVAYGRGGFRSINIRGVEGNRVLLLVDGIRLPDEFLLGGSEPLGRDYIDPDSLKRVEILQGSASALYGSDALGGVVAFMTKSPEDYLTEAGRAYTTRYRITSDSVNRSLAHSVTAAAGTGPLQGLLVYTRRDGEQTENNGAVQPNPENFTSDSVLAKLAWSPAKPHRLELTAEYLTREHIADVDNKEIVSGTATTADLRTISDTERFRLSLGYTFSSTGHALFDTLDARIYTQDSVLRDRTRELINYNPPSSANGSFRDRRIETAYHNDTIGLSAHATKRLYEHHRFAYGVETSVTDTSKPWIATVINSRGTTPQDSPRMAGTETTRLGAYLQDEMDWTLAGGRKFAVIPGVRVDRFELIPDNSPLYLATTAGIRAPSFDAVAVSPKLGVLVGLTNRFNAYAQYNRGFRYPTAEDLTATFTNAAVRYRTLPNPDLQEETSDAYEVGIKGKLSAILHVRVAAFYNTYDNFIEQIANAPAQFQDPVNWPSGTFMTQNRADARIYGGDFSATLILDTLAPSLRGFTVTAALGRSRGSYRAAGGTRTDLNTIEPFKANVRLAYDSAGGRWGLNLRATHAVAREPVTTAQFETPASTILDLDGYWKLHEHVSLRFSLRNLTDEKYWHYASIRGLAATALTERERRTEPGFNAAVSLSLLY